MIDVQDLVYTYPRQPLPTVKKISFQVRQGEIFGFLGPSGAGKSTTQKVLTKLLGDFEGQVLVKGKALQSWGIGYYNHIGVGFELPNHYHKLTAEENLRFFGSFPCSGPSSFYIQPNRERRRGACSPSACFSIWLCCTVCSGCFGSGFGSSDKFR